MGCGSSKLDDLPAVGLCRERCAFLDEAIHQRYAFAEAHVAYMHSLKVVGESLRRFFDQDLHSSAGRPPSPVLNLPSKRKGDPEPSGHPKPAIHHSDSSSDSHLHFDSDEEDSGSESLHHHLDAGSPVHPYGQMNYVDEETLGSYPGGGGGGGGGFMHMNYMQNRATPSVSYQQRPISTETVQMGESSSFNPYPYANQNVNNPYGYYNYSNYGGYFASSPPRQYGYSAPAAPQAMSSSVASSSKPPPPPPSPPRASAWDFLNPFGNTDNHYAPYTPSRDSREVREEEGIPDLEEEDYEDVKEVLGLVKEVRGHQKFVDSGGGGGGKYSPEMASDEAKGNDSESLYRGKPAPPSMENNPLEYEVHMVDKKVVNKEEISGDRSNGAGSKALGDTEIVRQIEGEFVRASESGNDNELVKMLEVGKLPHNRKHAAYQASKMLNMISPSLTVVASKNETADPALLDVDEGLGLKSTTLSSTLRKLFLWEKKLYEEVKVEEKMRILHEKKCRKLKRMDERGAEAHKVESTRTLVRSLSTKIRISIQVVDKISVKINKLRDEELWPQLNEFIQGLTRMWKSMLESHRTQCRAITEAKRLDSISSHKHLSDAHLESTIQLEHELLNWALRFSCWAGAQKGFVRALNNWLLKSLLYVPEETPDGIIPFSPSRIGAPPVFGVCNQWSQSLDQISEHEVVGSMRGLAATVMEVWERHKLETRQRTMAAAGDGKDGERRVRNLEREDQKVQREIQALDKMIVVSLDRERGGGLALGQAVYQSETSKNGSLQTSLQQVFEAVERFTANNVKAYEDLLQRIEEDNNRAPQES